MSAIATVGVIGAGVMGAGIAAHAANAGAGVVLLDIVEGASDEALARLKKSDPPAFVHPSVAGRIRTGATGDGLDLIAGCDWVVEAIVERVGDKRALYRSLAPHLKAGAVLSSNTSTIPLRRLADGMDAALRSRFLITHFFNPPRYMRLLEVVAGTETDSGVLERLAAFAEQRMGKSVVAANDTPGFIANRIGTFWVHSAVVEGLRRGIGVEEADAVLGRPAGVPKTGVFGLLDLVGIDLMPHVLESLADTLHTGDPIRALGPVPERIESMIAAGYTGRKGKGGFYRLGDGGAKEVIDLAGGTYGPVRRPRPAAVERSRKGGLRALVDHDSPEGRYARRVILSTLSYAASLVPEIADDPHAIDRAMRLGYHWEKGPFELIDELGAAWLVRALGADGLPVPEILERIGEGRFYRVQDGRVQQYCLPGYRNIRRAEGVELLADIRRLRAPLLRNRSAAVWDVGDGIACLEFTSKMNTIDPLTLAMIRRCARLLPGRGFRGLVIHNDGRHFSLGANVALAMIAARLHLWPLIRWLVVYGQRTLDAIKHAPFPVVGAPSGMVLGGGCEVLLHCDAVEADVESYIGLVETGLGIVPAWGGCRELLARWSADDGRPGGPMPPVMKTFEVIAMAKVSRSAHEARELGFLRRDDGIVMNRDHLLARARQRALGMADDYSPPAWFSFRLPGASGRAALELGLRDFVNRGLASAHDAVVARALANVLCGGDTDVLASVDGDRLLALEREAVMALIRTPATRARIEHVLKTGKPLRN